MHALDWIDTIDTLDPAVVFGIFVCGLMVWALSQTVRKGPRA